jgi:hypothetical protein
MRELQHETPEVQDEEPEWVQRMRAKGYNIRVGTTGEPMSEVPEAMFDPPMRTWLSSIRQGTGAATSVLRNVFRPRSSNRQARHAPLP